MKNTRSELKTIYFSFALACFVLSIFVFTPLESLRAQTPAQESSLTTNPVFENNCAKCHGKTAEGRHFAGPSLVSAKVKAATDDDIFNMISNGKHRMPKFSSKLTPEEIHTLVRQIKQAQK